MARTVRNLLKELEAQELKRFKSGLKELPVWPGCVNIPEERLQRADALDLSRMLVGYYGPRSALQVTLEALEAANCKAQAKKLREITGIGLKSAGADFQHSGGCTPGAKNLHRVPELSHFSDIPSDSVLNRSGGRRQRAGKLSRGTTDTDTGYGERSRSDFSNPPAKRLVLNYPELIDDIGEDYEWAFSYTADEVDDYECDFDSIADDVDDYECTFNSTAVVRSTGKMEIPTDPWKGVICDECPYETTLAERFVPNIDWDSQRSCETYSFVTTGAGFLHCSYTDLLFKVTEAVTITYRVDFWNNHSEVEKTRELIIAGPLFDIQADPVEALAAVHFPHFLCLADEDCSKVQIAHFSEGVMSLDDPDDVGPFHAVLETPTSSPHGVVAGSFNNEEKIHTMALLYHLEAPGSSAHTFHLYLLPNNLCLKKAVDDQELRNRSRRVPKLPGIPRPLRINTTFFVQKSDDIRVTPRKCKFDKLNLDKQQQYFEVYAEKIKYTLELCLMEEQDKVEEPFWGAWVRKEDLMQPELPPPPPADNDKSPNTNRDHLLHILENFKEDDLKKFKDKLHEFPIKDDYDNIPRGRLQKADPLDLKNLLFQYYNDYAMELTIEVLKAANLKHHAESLASSLGERADWSR